MNNIPGVDDADATRQSRRNVERIVAATFLWVAAVAAVAMVWTRLQADFDHPTIAESLRAIDANVMWFQLHGTARIWLGAALIMSQIFIGASLSDNRQLTFRLGRNFMLFGGIAFIVSGVIVTILPSAIAFDEVLGIDAESYYEYRGIAGNIGSSLVGSALIAFAPAQWRSGHAMKYAAILGTVTGVGMLIVWWDAATFMHRVTGAGFLVWLLMMALLTVWDRGTKQGDDPNSYRMRVE